MYYLNDGTEIYIWNYKLYLEPDDESPPINITQNDIDNLQYLLNKIEKEKEDNENLQNTL